MLLSCYVIIFVIIGVLKMTIDIRATVSEAEIKATIEQMAAAGDKITNRSLRERLGGGSPNRISKILREWVDASKPQEPAKAVLPEELAAIYADIHAKQRSATAAPLLSEIAKLQADVDDATDDNEKLEQKLIALTDLNTALEEQQREATTLAGARQQRIKQLEADQQRLQQQTQEQTQELATAAAKLSMQQEQSQRLQQQLSTAQAQQAEQGAALAVAQQAAAVAKAEAVAEAKAGAAANIRIERLEQQLEQIQAQANAKLEAMQQRLDEAQQQRTADAQAHSKEAQQHAKALAQREEQVHAEHKKNTELMTQIDELSDKVKALTTAKNKTKEG